MLQSAIVIALLATLYSANAWSFRKGSMSKLSIQNLMRTPSRYTRTSPLHASIPNQEAIEAEIGFKINPRRFIKATKQLATLGPASNYFEMIEKLFLSGADVFRLNFSHGGHEEKANLVDMIRQVEKKYNYPIAILGDLQGPKLRVGMFEEDFVTMIEGQSFTFDYKDDLGDAYRVQLPHLEILNTLKAGDIILLDDGKLKMKVTATTMAAKGEEGSVTCEVVVGGKLSNRKGVNTPSIVIPISPLTPKDRADLEFILTLDIDWVALSFVQTAADMREFRSLASSKPVKLMAKLEKPSAIDELDAIVALSDGIMVARGDLGVEMSPWDVPIVQKKIVEQCKKMGKPVVIATQMMESMIENPTPTRAEASDCATAVFESSDAVMLSAESAAGKYPVESVTMQQLIINKVEQDTNFQASLETFAQKMAVSPDDSKDITSSAITMAVRQVAMLSKSRAIVVFTSSGGTATNVAKIRPNCPIIAACESVQIARQLSLVWGVHPIVIEPPAVPFNIRVELEKVCRMTCEAGYADPDKDLLTFTAGLPFGTPGTTNLIRVTAASGPDYWLDPDNSEGGMKKYEYNGSPDCEL